MAGKAVRYTTAQQLDVGFAVADAHCMDIPEKNQIPAPDPATIKGKAVMTLQLMQSCSAALEGSMSGGPQVGEDQVKQRMEAMKNMSHEMVKGQAESAVVGMTKDVTDMKNAEGAAEEAEVKKAAVANAKAGLKKDLMGMQKGLMDMKKADEGLFEEVEVKRRALAIVGAMDVCGAIGTSLSLSLALSLSLSLCLCLSLSLSAFN